MLRVGIDHTAQKHLLDASEGIYIVDTQPYRINSVRADGNDLISLVCLGVRRQKMDLVVLILRNCQHNSVIFFSDIKLPFPEQCVCIDVREIYCLMYIEFKIEVTCGKNAKHCAVRLILFPADLAVIGHERINPYIRKVFCERIEFSIVLMRAEDIGLFEPELCALLFAFFVDRH